MHFQLVMFPTQDMLSGMEPHRQVRSLWISVSVHLEPTLGPCLPTGMHLRQNPRNLLYFLLSCFILAVCFLTSRDFASVDTYLPDSFFPSFLCGSSALSAPCFYLFLISSLSLSSLWEIRVMRLDWLCETWAECMGKVEKKTKLRTSSLIYCPLFTEPSSDFP